MNRARYNKIGFGGLLCCLIYCLPVSAQWSVSTLNKNDSLELQLSKQRMDTATKFFCVCMDCQNSKFRHHIISLNVADYILQKYNVAYEYLSQKEKWRIRVPVFVDVKDQNYGVAVNAYSNWRISKHVTHIIGGSLQGEYIGSFYQDFYLKFRPRGFAIDPDFATGMVFTAADRFVFGIDAAVGPGMVFRDNRFKGVFLDVRLGLSVGIKF